MRVERHRTIVLLTAIKKKIYPKKQQQKKKNEWIPTFLIIMIIAQKDKQHKNTAPGSHDFVNIMHTVSPVTIMLLCQILLPRHIIITALELTQTLYLRSVCTV